MGGGHAPGEEHRPLHRPRVEQNHVAGQGPEEVAQRCVLRRVRQRLRQPVDDPFVDATDVHLTDGLDFFPRLLQDVVVEAEDAFGLVTGLLRDPFPFLGEGKGMKV